MKRYDRDELKIAITRLDAAQTGALLNSLRKWNFTHEHKNNSFHWTPPLAAADRRREEADNSFTERVTIGKATITYTSDLYVSCHNYYWTDSLTLEGSNSRYINFADIKSLIETAGNHINRLYERDIPLVV